MHGSLLTAILWSAIPAILLMAAIYYLDRYEKEPVRLIGIALVAGAVVAPIATAWVEKAFGVPNSLASQAFFFIGAENANQPVIEEIVRGLVLVAVFFLVRYEIDDLLDGLVYGGMVGVGFGLAANFWTVWTTPPIAGGLTNHSLFSTIVASFNWVFYAGVIGLCLAAARRASLARVASMAVLGTGIAMGFHLLHDFLPTWVAADASNVQTSGLAKFLADLPNVLGLVALAAIAVWALGREKLIVARELQDEVTSGVVAPEEFKAITNPGRRFGSLASAMGKGMATWRLRRRLYVLEVELAFRKYHDKSERTTPAQLATPEEYRRQIAETRRAMGGGATVAEPAS